MAEKVAKFRLIEYKILKSSIEVKDEAGIAGDLGIEFGKKSFVEEGENKFVLDIGVSVKDKNENLNIEVNILGFFEFDREITDQEKEIFFNTSAPALLFPYIRAYISTLTSLSGIKMVMLPTINLSGNS